MTPSRNAELVDAHAERFKALGHPVRLSILRLIVQGPEEGTPAGTIQEHVGVPASTLSHHLACLSETQLVVVTREGTFLRYRADFRTLRQLTEFLWKDCCSGGIPETTAEIQPQSCCGVKVRKARRS